MCHLTSSGLSDARSQVLAADLGQSLLPLPPMQPDVHRVPAGHNPIGCTPLTKLTMQAAEVVARLMESGVHGSPQGRAAPPPGVPLMQHLTSCICARTLTGATHHDTASLR